ncbi:lactonase family protein [Lewinella sp. IMCC34183]|uniref:lactonase family protein n=1 Tax=Lewinella sp. IMCC34183 TaxID=2248762 RepID=UPI0013008419|nr:lactonase family protein [Lewinella sp. IMCC34183]
MRYYLALLSILFLACSTPSTTAQQGADETTFLLGTYNDDGVHAPGIYRYALRSDGTLDSRGRVAEINSPSFLAYNPDRSVLVAVEETETGSVAAFSVEGDSLEYLNSQPSGGGGPCHVNVSQDGYVGVANYGGGTAELLRLTADGSLSAPLDVSNHRSRGGETPHAHSSYFLNGGTEMLSVDLGTDEVWHYNLDKEDGKLVPHTPPSLRMEPGAGPRHLSIHPNGKWLYVINELNSTVTQVSRSGSELSVVDSWSTLPEDFTGESFCADIHVSRDGKFLYGSNRGHNSIVVYAISAASGALTPLEYEPVAGDWPRNFALSPDEQFLLVANQRSKNITTLRRNTKTGMLDFVTSTTAPIPVCILF